MSTSGQELTIRTTELLYDILRDSQDIEKVMKTRPVEDLLPGIATSASTAQDRKAVFDLVMSFGVACARQRAAGAPCVVLQYGTGKFFNAGGAHDDPLSQANTPAGELDSIHDQIFEILKPLGRNFFVTSAMKIINSTTFTAAGYLDFKFKLRILNYWATAIITSKNFRGKDKRAGLDLQGKLRQWHNEQSAPAATQPSVASTSASGAEQAEHQLLLADRHRRESYTFRLARARSVISLNDLSLKEVESLKDHLRHLIWSGYASNWAGMRSLIWDRCLIALGREALDVLLSNAILFVKGRDGHQVQKYGVAKQGGSSSTPSSNKGKRKASVSQDSDSESFAEDDGDESEEEVPHKAGKVKASGSRAKSTSKVKKKDARSTSKLKYRKIMESTIGRRSDVFVPFPTATCSALAEHPVAAHFARFNIRSPETLYTEYAPDVVNAPSLPGIHTYRSLHLFVEYYGGFLDKDVAQAPWNVAEYEGREEQCLNEAVELINGLKTIYDARAASEGCSHPGCFLNAVTGRTPSRGGPNPYRPRDVLCFRHVQEAMFVQKQLGIQTWQGYLEETEECSASSESHSSEKYLFTVESYANCFKDCDGLCDEEIFVGPAYRRLTKSASGEGMPHTGMGWGCCYTCSTQDGKEARKQAAGARNAGGKVVIEPWEAHDSARSILCGNPLGRRDCARYAPQQSSRRLGSSKMISYGFLADNRWLCRVCVGEYGKLVTYAHASYAPMRNRVRRALEEQNTLQRAGKLPRMEIYLLLHGLPLALIPGSFVSVGAMVRSMPELRDLLLIHENEEKLLLEIAHLGRATTV